ncbi:NisI/SpaI family lantibiotic immunity lipoprotein [Streptococcus suis]|uniref:NisI/SpaI family lantibiotic immunity lipoprotein n=1 Tax=Streptococcus suis TaxID=1307 RepID=UPI0027960E9A|nr:NisI/SpaI family lantibiotic immunity lipoprotein [Streptococcus suis]
MKLTVRRQKWCLFFFPYKAVSFLIRTVREHRRNIFYNRLIRNRKKEIICHSNCSSSSAGLSFDEGYQTFRYKGKDYAVSKQEVAEDSIQGTEVKFMEWPVVKEEGSVKKTVSLNNLYITTSKEWAIGVLDGYYKVDLVDNIAESDRIDYQALLDTVDLSKEIN